MYIRRKREEKTRTKTRTREKKLPTLNFPLSTFNSVSSVCLDTSFHFHYELYAVYKVNNNTLNCLRASECVCVFLFISFCIFRVAEK